QLSRNQLHAAHNRTAWAFELCERPAKKTNFTSRECQAGDNAGHKQRVCFSAACRATVSDYLGHRLLRPAAIKRMCQTTRAQELDLSRLPAPHDFKHTRHSCITPLCVPSLTPAEGVPTRANP